jgi:hypothetical protein
MPTSESLAVIADRLAPGALSWYSSLSEGEQAVADRITNDIASDVFDKSLGDLTQEEANQLHLLARYGFLDATFPANVPTTRRSARPIS